MRPRTVQNIGDIKSKSELQVHQNYIFETTNS